MEKSVPSDRPTIEVPKTSAWDDMAVYYEQLLEPLRSQFVEPALMFAGGVRPGDRVLDVGTGPGALNGE